MKKEKKSLKIWLLWCIQKKTPYESHWIFFLFFVARKTNGAPLKCTRQIDPKNEIFPKNKSPSVLSHTFITCTTTVRGRAEANPSRPTPSLNITCLPSCLDTHRLCCAAAAAVVARHLSAFLSAGVDQSVS